MKAAITCPNCGNKGIIEINIPLMIVLWLLGLIPGIIYSLIIWKRYKCPKCGCMRQPIVSVKETK